MNILEEIIQTKVFEVEELKKRFSSSELDIRIMRAQIPRDFKKALLAPHSLIAEVKKASPSSGVLIDDFDPLKIAKEYEAAGATAISVLTDRKYFHGSLDHLEVIAKNLNAPVLRKDFIIDELQVCEARMHSADAVLLIARVLEHKRLKGLLDKAMSLGMNALVEVHDGADIEKAVECGAEIIGINNRDLSDFKTDINRTLKLITLIPKGKIIVSESGIKTAEDIKELRSKGVNSMLVGESLLRSGDLTQKVKELTKW